MRRAFLLAFIFLTFAVLPMIAQPEASEEAAQDRWERAWGVAEAGSSFAPSKLAKELVRTGVRGRAGESPEDLAARAFAAAVAAERALRLGYTYQEARAQLRQRDRLEVSSGNGKGKRIAAKLAAIERKSAIRGKANGRKPPPKTEQDPEKEKKGK